jgi:hypothetical protein
MRELGYFRHVLFPGCRKVSQMERIMYEYNTRLIEGKSLVSPETHRVIQTEDDGFDVPDEMEGILDDLFQAIQDKVFCFGHSQTSSF